MSPADLEALEDQVTALRHAMWGVQGDNGVITDVRDLIRKFDAYVAVETKRREDEAKEQRSRDRAMTLAAVAALVSAIGVIATLIAVISVP